MSFSGLSFRRTPATLAILISLTLASVFFWATQDRGMDALAVTAASFQQPWRFFSYLWASSPLGSSLSLVCFVFTLFWLASIGPSLEDTMGSAHFGVAWLVAGLLGSIGVTAGFLVMHQNGYFAGPWLAISAISVLWCARNTTAVINLWGLIPMNARVLAIVMGVTDVLLVGSGAPLVGILAACPLLFWWFFGLERFSWLPCAAAKVGRKAEEKVVIGGQVYDDKYFDDVRERERERAERERLRKLLGE